MNYRDYRVVFQNFALQPGNSIQSFSMSDDDRVLSLQQSNTRYPQLQLDTPTYKAEINRGGTDKKFYYGQVAIMAPVPVKGDFKTEDDILDSLEEEMDNLIAWIDYHRKFSFGTVREIGTVYPIKRYEHANLFGWGVQITIETKKNYCHTESSDVKILHLFPQFITEETILQIEVESVVYAYNLTEESRMNAALIDIASQINANTPTSQVTSQVFNETLILVHQQPLTNINYNSALAGHGWEVTDI